MGSEVEEIKMDGKWEGGRCLYGLGFWGLDGQVLDALSWTL